MIQPSREDLIEASSYLVTAPVCIDLQLLVFSEDVDFKYDTEITINGKDAVWNGLAIARFQEKNFYQECKSQCNGSDSCKQYRNAWVKTNTQSPCVQLNELLNNVKDIGTTYYKKPEAIKDKALLFDDMENQVYEIFVRDVKLQWNALCDANLDSLFGERDLFERYDTLDLSLFFDVKSHELVGIHAFESDGDCLIELSMRFMETDKAPVVTPTESIQIQDGVLNEEWELTLPQ